MHKEISGVILAGGRATRMGGEDKGLVSIGGIALYQYVLARLRPQVASVAISANRNQARYQTSGLPVIGDLTPIRRAVGRDARRAQAISQRVGGLCPL